MIIIEDGSGAIEYYYGKMGKVAKTRRTLIVPNQTVATYVTQWKYDSHNRLLEMIYPDEEKVTYGYNLGGQVDHVRGYKSYGYDYVNKIGYHKFEQRTYLKYCNGAETFYSYDPQRRRLQNLAVNAGGKTIMDSVLQLQSIKDNYKTFDLPYNGVDNSDYVNGKGFSSDDDTLEAAQARAMVKTRAGEAGTNERMQFYYHPDHLVSSSYITNFDGEVSQHIEYVPYGEVFIDELELTRKSATAGKANCNNTWNTPYRFNDCANEGRGRLACSMPSAANRRVELNAKELDEETGMYYYGARYYEPRLSLWMSTDPMEEKYPATSSYCFVANNPIKYFDLDGLQLWVANNEAMSLLLHTLAPEDRGYVVRDKNGFIDSKILTEGVKHSVSNSENLKSLQKIVADPDNTVRLYGLVEQYDFLSVNNEKKTKIFDAPNRQNLYRELMEGFSGDESMKAKYSETLIQQGIVDEYELTGNLGATLRPKRLTNVFPAGQMSMSNDVEIYISCKGTTTLEQVKTLGHELYGHTLFGISGLDPRHGGNTGRPDGNPTLEKQIIKSEMESEKNYNQ